MWSLAFSAVPGVSWADPSHTIYVADGVTAMGPARYPSPQPYGGCGTSVIFPPNERQADTPAKDWYNYFTNSRSRRFADRHIGTNVLLVNGQVANYQTEVLDSMTDGSASCIWDAD